MLFAEIYAAEEASGAWNYTVVQLFARRAGKGF